MKKVVALALLAIPGLCFAQKTGQYKNAVDKASALGLVHRTARRGGASPGTVIETIPSGLASILGCHLEEGTNSCYIFSEAGSNTIRVLDITPPHAQQALFNRAVIAGQADFNCDGGVIVGGMLYTSDFQGDLTVDDDNVTSATVAAPSVLVDAWQFDGAGNTNNGGAPTLINQILDISPDNSGIPNQFFISQGFLGNDVTRVLMTPGGGPASTWMGLGVVTLPAGISDNWGIKRLPSGNFLSTDFNSGTIQVVDSTLTTVLLTLTNGPANSGGDGIAAANSPSGLNEIWACYFGTNDVTRIEADSSVPVELQYFKVKSSKS